MRLRSRRGTVKTPQPLWRWWLFCLALDLRNRMWPHHWSWLDSLYAWCVLPEWLGHDTENDCDTARAGGEEEPF